MVRPILEKLVEKRPAQCNVIIPGKKDTPSVILKDAYNRIAR